MKLSPREQEIAVLVGHGLTNRQIAERHIGDLLGKLGCPARPCISSAL